MLIKCVSDLTLGGVCGSDSLNQNLDQLTWLEWWIIFYKKRHNPALTYRKINDTSVRWEQGDKRAVFTHDEFSVNQQCNAGASKDNVMGSVLCLQNEKLDSPAQFQDDEAISVCFWAPENDQIVRNLGNKFLDISLSNVFVDLTPKERKTKTKINK